MCSSDLVAFFPQASVSFPKVSALLPQASPFLPQARMILPQAPAFLPQGAAVLPQAEALFTSKKGVASSGHREHNGAEQINQVAGMAFYDTPGTLYDSGQFYDSAPAPQTTKTKMAKVKLALNTLTVDETMALANTVKTALTGNANFTTPTPSLATFGTQLTTASTKIAAYNSLVAAATAGLADRDAGVAVVKASLTQLCDYVQSASGGDAVKIESAGMSVRADRTPVTMTQVLNLAVSEGDNPASLDAMWKPVAGVRSYECQVNSSDPNVEANWSFKQSTSKSSVTLTGLTSGTKVWVRVRAIGGNDNAGPYSDPATKVVP